MTWYLWAWVCIWNIFWQFDSPWKSICMRQSDIIYTTQQLGYTLIYIPYNILKALQFLGENNLLSFLILPQDRMMMMMTIWHILSSHSSMVLPLIGCRFSLYIPSTLTIIQRNWGTRKCLYFSSKKKLVTSLRIQYTSFGL